VFSFKRCRPIKLCSSRLPEFKEAGPATPNMAGGWHDGTGLGSAGRAWPGRAGLGWAERHPQPEAGTTALDCVPFGSLLPSHNLRRNWRFGNARFAMPNFETNCDSKLHATELYNSNITVLKSMTHSNWRISPAESDTQILVGKVCFATQAQITENGNHEGTGRERLFSDTKKSKTRITIGARRCRGHAAYASTLPTSVHKQVWNDLCAAQKVASKSKSQMVERGPALVASPLQDLMPRYKSIWLFCVANLSRGNATYNQH